METTRDLEKLLRQAQRGVESLPHSAEKTKLQNRCLAASSLLRCVKYDVLALAPEVEDEFVDWGIRALINMIIVYTNLLADDAVQATSETS